jgi:hypothetical protein
MKKINGPPYQEDFDDNDIRGMEISRRQLKTEWPTVLRPPSEPGSDWSMVLPFPNTYKNAFLSMCRVPVHTHRGKTGKLCLFLRGTADDAEAREEVRRWVEVVSQPVAMKDHLALSFALDYERICGSPDQEQTDVGRLRFKAKPYGDKPATKENEVAADELVGRCLAFLKEMTCYKSADCIVAMPPADPTKQYSLPGYIARGIAREWGREDLTNSLRTISPRNPIKGVPLAQKLDTLLGTIKVDYKVFQGRRVVLVDDLYQSGISMNYAGSLLLRAGAHKIFGLACEKTCRNDDNVREKI